MSIELNELLKDKWFVLDNNGAVMNRKSKEDAHESAQRWKKAYPYAPPHHAVQLQVKGTLPEGAIMPIFWLGEKVVSNYGSGEIVYVMPMYVVLYEDGMEKKSYAHELSSAPPADPMREEFEKAWYSQKQADENEKEAAYLGFRLAKAGAK